MTPTRNRIAYTLIELMVVMSVSATVLAVAVGWIHQSMKVASVMRERQEHHHNLLRLSRQLRDDVHRGESMSVEDENRMLVIQMDDRKISFAILEDGRVQRLNRKGEVITQQELFSLDRTSLPRWETSRMPNWISLVVDRGLGLETANPGHHRVDQSTEPAPADLHVSAAIGRWKQLLSATNPSLQKESP